jgi:hypothetical protein
MSRNSESFVPEAVPSLCFAKEVILIMNGYPYSLPPLTGQPRGVEEKVFHKD